ncbi:MAG: hypothetical protein HC930_11070, partial [Hydrococcus sp. SU_1_0]|nr:hypothetical protein [Hydrococcus sp. SU_1_0]
MVTNNQSIKTVHLFVTSLGNHFMIEIAEIFHEGFKNNGVESQIKVDQRPSTHPEPGLIQIVIAPHEFFNLFLEQNLNSREKLNDFAKAVYLLNTEQPGTPWFEMTCHRAKFSLGVLDIAKNTALEYRQRGIMAVHAPLGYASCFEAGVDPHLLPDRNFELLFLGSISAKRDLFISQHAALFNRYQSKIVITRVKKPRFSHTAGFLPIKNGIVYFVQAKS